MRTLAVFAHFDPDGFLAPHARRHLEQVAATVERLVIVSTADLTAEADRKLAGLGEVLRRPNQGYDFFSWKCGLEHVGAWDRFDRVLLTNDSVVGPLRPLGEVLSSPPAGADFWGMTVSHELGLHVQSWFTVMERRALDCGPLHGFWRAMTPVSRRYDVIRRYEIGMSRVVTGSGLRVGSWFRPRPYERVRAELRYQRYLSRRASRYTPAQRGRRPSREQRLVRDRWNPTQACWEAALDGRLPYVKLELLRDDAYGLGAEAILNRLERAYPGEFQGVREQIERTRERLKVLRSGR